VLSLEWGSKRQSPRWRCGGMGANTLGIFFF